MTKLLSIKFICKCNSSIIILENDYWGCHEHLAPTASMGTKKRPEKHHADGMVNGKRPRHSPLQLFSSRVRRPWFRGFFLRQSPTIELNEQHAAIAGNGRSTGGRPLECRRPLLQCTRYQMYEEFEDACRCTR